MQKTTVETFRCMMCGHEYREKVTEGEDREWVCPECRSNSIRLLKRSGKKGESPASNARKGNGGDDARGSR